MTLIVSWIAMDNKRGVHTPSSIYIASDSRISWENQYFDYGRKIFGCRNYPDIFGYSGDVLFPSIVISQIIEIIDNDLLFNNDMSCEEKMNLFYEQLVKSLEKYPVEFENIINESFAIIHSSRDSQNQFACCEYRWNRKGNVWECHMIDLPSHSGLLYVSGSGKQEFRNNLSKFESRDASGTSRNIFQCFCNTLSNMMDKYCGGAPQLIGLYRKNNSIPFGIIYDEKRFFNGYEVTNLKSFDNIAWRNSLFEICDGETMSIKDNSQRQPNPLMK